MGIDPRLLQYYERELQYVREMGAEFARDYPKIAGRLGMEGLECADPYVERLLEAFAFLAARVQLKIDAEFPKLTQHLLEVMYPHYLAPTPSMTVVQMLPNPNEGALASGFRVPRDTVLRAKAGRRDATACEFRTRQELTLWPIEVEDVEYVNLLGDLVGGEWSQTGAVAAIRIVLRATGGLHWSQLNVESLPFFCQGGDDVASRFHEMLCANCVGILARAEGSRGRFRMIGDQAQVQGLGFGDDEGLLPDVSRSFRGYRLLQEYFAFPARFMFASIGGLRLAAEDVPGSGLELLVLLNKDEASLHGTIGRERLVPFCTPAINLFPHEGDRIHIQQRERELHVVPDRTRPMDLEVYGLKEVVGYGRRGTMAQAFRPLFASRGRRDRVSDTAYFTVLRRPRRLSMRQRQDGPRSSYVGSEVYVSLVDVNAQPYRSDLRQLAVSLMCTNRDLALHVPLGQGEADFSLQASAPVASIRCVAGPSAPRASHAHGAMAWRLVSHLTLNYMALSDPDPERAAAGVRELLSLYAELGEPAMVQQIQGVARMTQKHVVRAVRGSGPVHFAQGLEVNLHCDEDAFSGATPYVLASVLRQFFARHVSINSFVETVLSTVQRGEVARWPMQTGLRPML